MKDEITFDQVVQWIEELQCQNSIDFQGIKNIKESIKKLNSEITKAKNLNNSINKKILSEYEKIKKIILDENVSVTLDNKISNVNKLLNDLKSNVYSLENGQAFEKKINENIKTISSQLDTIIQQRGYVTYEDFGAKGDGVTDDGNAIKQAHLKANELNKFVFCPTPKEFYVKEIENIPIETNVNWNGSTIIIDDNTTLTNPIFIVKSTKETQVLNRSQCSSLIDLGENSVEIPLLKGYGEAFVEIINEDKKIYIREGANADSGSNLCDMTIVDNNGLIKEKLNWHFDKVTRLVVMPLPSEYLILENGIFKTISDSMNSYAYINRGITVNRSKTILKKITHSIVQSKESVGRCYNGFIYLSHCCDIQLLDTSLTPRFFKYINSVASGTYDFGVSYCLNLYVDNLQAFSNSDSYWGVWGGNFIKNLSILNSKLNRVDAHKGVFNLTIKDTTIGNRGITVCGGGTLILNNIDVYSSDLVTFRGDYGATWLGDIFIDNIRHYPKSKYNNILNCSYNVDHDYGYECTLGKNIVSIKNYTVYPQIQDIDTIAILFTSLTHTENNSILSPYYISENIIIENLYVDNPLVGYVVFKGFNGKLLKARREGMLIKGTSVNNEYPITLTPNVLINIKNIQSSTKNVGYSSSTLINFKNDYGNIATDEYGNNPLDVLIRFTIDNCNKLVSSVFGLPCIVNINNSNICMCINKNGGSRAKTIINNCEIMPLTSKIQTCLRCNSLESYINNTVFSNPNNLIIDVTSLKGIYEIFNIYGDRTYKNLADINNCKFDDTLNIIDIAPNILDIAPNFPNGKNNTYEFPKIGTSTLRKELSSYGYLQGVITNFYDTDLNKMLYKYGVTWKDSIGNDIT